MEKIRYEEFLYPAARRAKQMAVKSEAVWVVFNELGGLINVSRLAKDYFGRTHGWLAQKINRYSVDGKIRQFTPEEYAQLSEAFRNIAKRLEKYAEEIDSAEER